jgi:glyoxylase-like metal-dependent hydrolase (beta-lactamase superfamily II)
VVATHFHPDHVGLVGWLTERFNIPLYMPRTEFLTSLALQHRAFAINRPFYEEHGLGQEVTDLVVTNGHHYLRLVSELPTQFQQLAMGGTFMIGGRRFDIVTGGGHAPEQAMLYCVDENIFFSADQVLTRISPNISVQPMEPEADPLGRGGCTGAAGPPRAVYRIARARRRTRGAPRRTLRPHRGRVPHRTAQRHRPGAGGVLTRNGSAPNGIRVQRSGRARELHAQPRRVGAVPGC